MKKFLEKKFHLSEQGTTLQKELLAGLTTFATMSYIIFLNPLILSEAGIDFRAAMFATLVASSLSSLCMGVFANYPFALAPSMGLNAYFSYTVVQTYGYSWQAALGACFLAGIALLALNALGLRQLLLQATPSCLRLSISGGIGIFLAFIGLKNVGLIQAHPSTLLQLGKVSSRAVLFGLIGIALLAALKSRKIAGSFLLAILAVWALSLLSGDAVWQGLFSAPPDPTPTLFVLDINRALSPDLGFVILSFIFVALFDSTGTLLALAEQGGFLDAEGQLPRAKRALASDALGTAFGALIGTSPLTIYLDSASGISAGGKTGLTSVFVSLFFLAALFLTPLAASIPAYASSPVLLALGALMLRPVSRLDWNDPSEFIPAFVTLISIPLTFSIANGIAFGFILYPLIKALSGKIRETSLLIWLLAASFTALFIWG